MPSIPLTTGLFLVEVAMLRDVVNHIEPESQDDISVAQAIFDWTVRNIQISSPPGADASPIDQWPATSTFLKK